MIVKRTLTREEFCKMTHTSKDCWIFEDMVPNPEGNFWEEDGHVCFDNGKDTLMKFRDMPGYEEVWMISRKYGGDWSPLWTTWKQY